MVRMEWIVSCGERVMKRFKGPLAAAATSYQSVSQSRDYDDGERVA